MEEERISQQRSQLPLSRYTPSLSPFSTPQRFGRGTPADTPLATYVQRRPIIPASTRRHTGQVKYTAAAAQCIECNIDNTLFIADPIINAVLISES